MSEDDLPPITDDIPEDEAEADAGHTFLVDAEGEPETQEPDDADA